VELTAGLTYLSLARKTNMSGNVHLHVCVRCTEKGFEPFFISRAETPLLISS